MIGVITALFAGLAVMVYAVQAWLMRETLIRSNRAYVHIDTMIQEPLHDEQGGFIGLWVAPTWENSGNTPTRRLINYINFDFFTEEPDEKFEFPNILASPAAKPAKLLLGPKQRLNGQHHIIGPDVIVAAAENRCFAYVWGWAEYEDVFRLTRRHRTEFCYRIAATRISEGHRFHVILSVHWEFNGADGSCYRRPGNRAPERRPMSSMKPAPGLL